jgi:hypothetical protein
MIFIKNQDFSGFAFGKMKGDRSPHHSGAQNYDIGRFE